jgi:hypothetical protein
MTESIKVVSPEICAWCARRKGEKQKTIKDQWTFTDSRVSALGVRQSHEVIVTAVVQQCAECESFAKRIKPIEISVVVLEVVSYIAAITGSYYSIKSGNWLLAIMLWLYIFYGMCVIMLFDRKDYLKNVLMELIIKTFFAKYRPEGYSFNSTNCFQVMRDEVANKNYLLFTNPDYQMEFEKLNPDLAKPKK